MIFEKAMDELLTIGFLTGSRAFGTAREDSDYDVCFDVSMAKKVEGIVSVYEDIDELGNKETACPDYETGSRYCQIDGNRVNLIFLHPDTVKAWEMATAAVAAVIHKAAGFEDRQKKLAVFKNLVAVFTLLTIER